MDSNIKSKAKTAAPDLLGGSDSDSAYYVVEESESDIEYTAFYRSDEIKDTYIQQRKDLFSDILNN